MSNMQYPDKLEFYFAGRFTEEIEDLHATAAIVDLDGTVVDHNTFQLPNPDFLAVATKVRRSGVAELSLFTGRAPQNAEYIAEAAEMEGVCAYLNGALVKRGSEVINKFYLPQDAALDIAARLHGERRVHWPTEGGVDLLSHPGLPEGMYAPPIQPWRKQTDIHNLAPSVRYEAVDTAFITVPVVGGAAVQNLKDTIRVQYGQLGITALSAIETMLPNGRIRHDVLILDHRANKREALKEAKANAQKRQAVSALGAWAICGDGPNDRTMLREADIAGGMHNGRAVYDVSHVLINNPAHFLQYYILKERDRFSIFERRKSPRQQKEPAQ